ncbi:hypothetical protein [Companilactobacillus nodensis]|uniref:Uncharacterized protein n=1 Tax=Companilactobacillus nodensis DSM 19682 = JCM 14932 = NBRC 107160 TaxID=1423775 RepID=A0A0R1KP58_9LACO|nr:hypothetical protein [Companilactobacillus nodensis]KRK81127.1 hypothetical protein FD03_GL000719 [Companilactobacillus nodensis DSM 19682 = JCM 14932 = NBRC 107160]
MKSIKNKDLKFFFTMIIILYLLENVTSGSNTWMSLKMIFQILLTGFIATIAMHYLIFKRFE